MQEAFDWGVCHVVNTLQFDVRASDTKRLGVGGMLTEFGAETQDADGLKVSDLGISFYSVGKVQAVLVRKCGLLIVGGGRWQWERWQVLDLAMMKQDEALQGDPPALSMASMRVRAPPVKHSCGIVASRVDLLEPHPQHRPCETEL